MTLKSGWCLAAQHDTCPVAACKCPCHVQVDGQTELLPDPRTTTEVPF